MSVTVRTRNFINNPLLARRQFLVDVIHPKKAGVSKAELRKTLAQMYKVQDEQTIILYGFKIQFGGGKSSGFGLIYDTVAAAKCYEPRYRLLRQGLATKVDSSRKQRKERKNRDKKFRGRKVVKQQVS
eukprot:TRINITY_DN44133_c0_g1_i1.p3 TRINITY_DN44133_c0_g1~~TRINITY_DN44133_c0_g1_i1.p3  ORF type:complete len:136 (-),score=14.28 TRINITY_DN44133_c0_g1_i1:188-571(-)